MQNGCINILNVEGPDKMKCIHVAYLTGSLIVAPLPHPNERGVGRRTKREAVSIGGFAG